MAADAAIYRSRVDYRRSLQYEMCNAKLKELVIEDVERMDVERNAPICWREPLYTDLLSRRDARLHR
jgi:hypothetical protein